MKEEGRGADEGDEPLANCTRASLTGFLRRFDMLAIDLVELKVWYTGLNRDRKVRKVLYIVLLIETWDVDDSGGGSAASGGSDACPAC